MHLSKLKLKKEYDATAVVERISTNNPHFADEYPSIRILGFAAPIRSEIFEEKEPVKSEDCPRRSFAELLALL